MHKDGKAMIIKEIETYVNSLTPFERECLVDILQHILPQHQIENSLENDSTGDELIEHCPHCRSVRFVKNGFNPGGKQKYRCKDCKAVFMSRTKTIFSSTKVSYETWIKFILGEINGLTLQQQHYETGLSKTTCFYMRHKLHEAVSTNVDSELSGIIYLDPTYTKINLKGTKPKNMPRISKKCGKHKTSGTHKSLSGISHHKICLITAVDDKDNILFKIAGLGSERREILNQFRGFFKQESTIVIDKKRDLETFVKDCNCIPDIVSANGYKSALGNTLSTVNQVHQEFSNLIIDKHGVSTRHLQGYLDWLVYVKQLRYRVEGYLRKLHTYEEILLNKVSLKKETICTKEFPINLKQAYGEYHYGIFA